MSRAHPVSPRVSAEAEALACAAELIEVLPAVMDTVRVAMRQHVGGGLSVPQFRCLNFVELQPGTSVSAVSAFMGTTLATASATADRLARAGLLEAVASATDRRRSELRVTAAGAALLEGMRASARQELAARLARMSPADVRRVRDGLAVLSTGFGRPQ